jgi:hypothetical protein
LLKAKLLGVLVFLVTTVVMTELLSILNMEIDCRFSVGFMIGTFTGILTNCWLRPISNDKK